MELVFLGTSAGVPTSDRNVSAVALVDGGRWDLFDCGEATQHQLLRTPLSLAKLRTVFISHLHGDHCFGLFGLLASRAMSGAAESLTVVGPLGVRDMVTTVLDKSSTYLDFDLHFRELPSEGGVVEADGEPRVEAVPLTHRVDSFAWSISRGPRPGRFDAAAAVRLGVAPGPQFAELQRGHSVEVDGGRFVHPREVVGPQRPGTALVIAGDNSDPARLLERVGPVDLLVHEATFTEEVLARLGDDRGHSTAARVAKAAADAGVRALILTHFSPRFRSTPAATHSIEEVEAEASALYSANLHLANDFDTFRIDLDGRVDRLG